MMILFVLLTAMMILAQADEDNKCVMIASWKGPISLVNLPSMTGSILASISFTINSFAPDRDNNVVYGLDASIGNLYVIDMCGNGLFIKKSNVLSATWGLAYNPNTKIFYAIKGGITWDYLWTIDANNNYAATQVAKLSHPFEGLVFAKDFSKLYGYSNIGPQQGLYTIDISTYATTYIAPFLTKGRSVDWENENDELSMILPTQSNELFSLDMNTNTYSLLGLYDANLGIDVRGLTAFYTDCDSVCNVCSDYKYINDDVARTQEDAEQECNSQFGTSLATITTTEQLVCALDLIGNNGESPWIGLYSHYEVGFFQFVDDTPCPVPAYGACVDSKWWVNDEPIQICEKEGGSKCVRLLTDEPVIGKINNDQKCQNTLNAVLCNSNIPL